MKMGTAYWDGNVAAAKLESISASFAGIYTPEKNTKLDFRVD
jgi:hypothetical protein